MIISEMQRKLAIWASNDSAWKADRLLRLIAHPTWLQEAARQVLASRGSKTAGIDGVTKTTLLPELDSCMGALRDELLEGSYTPAPAKRIYIQKANGKLRPLGIPTLRDRIVQRAMLMAMEPLWESDFHPMSYGFRPERSVHHAIRAVKLQLTDSTDTRGRWVIEGDLASYLDTVHHRLLMKCVRRRIRDQRFLTLLWRIIKAGHIEQGLFCAASEGVPQGGVLSPLLSNIMLHEFDSFLEERYLSRKARAARWSWNHSVQRESAVALREQRQWKPAVSYCRYADDFVIIVKGTKAQAHAIREDCRAVLEQTLHLTLNMEKTHITHVNDGFTFLGHRIIRKRGTRGTMHVVSTIPHDKAKRFRRELTALLSADHGRYTVEVIEQLNQKLIGWGQFYRFTDHVAEVFSRIDRAVFWKLAHWLGRKYRSRVRALLQRSCHPPVPGQPRTWVWFGPTSRGCYRRVYLTRLVGRGKQRFRWHTPRVNPYIQSSSAHPLTSRLSEVARAVGPA